ncbi:sulfite dehydrogenase (cytochrome) subunit SorA apoprotein [Modicisalibacter muralis]|uniref:Sulfite dehydrogenase (Cytochrome) subunit SorA apoprotein n=1 Tax=Modicisalibacter muralis TaxID=119000 RepID=A0A1G9I3Q0_9GAMM|nr:sulfite oxidase [Halomonas muralis]SDL19453.1 sulfite dehydrogenase (cytochrome) subunit SorA apoprotein [Halomonas muralis]
MFKDSEKTSNIEPAHDEPLDPGRPFHNIAMTSRRGFLTRAIGTGGGMVALSAGGLAVGSAAWAAESATAKDAPSLPDAVSWKDEDAFIVHGLNPITMETRRAAFGTSTLVPDTRLYIRNNLPVPDPTIVANRDAWQVSFEGVKKPKTLTLEELKKIGLHTVSTVLQCSGNGRGFFPHGASGSQWTVGAAGAVVWSGVRVRDVIESLGGPTSGMKFLTSTGGEELPAALERNTVVVERSIPLEKAMDDAILAWEMNGAPLELAHGGPLRLVVPGYYGCNNIKYVARVAFTAEESKASMQQTSYRIRPIGVSGAPDQPTMWEMNVKSWVNHPTADKEIAPGKVLLDGVAFSGMDPVEKVEVSVDGGKTWQQAEFIGPNLGRYAWRQFMFTAELGKGTHTIASRATDASGDTQPKARVENERGYGNNSWQDHAIEITVG